MQKDANTILLFTEHRAAIDYLSDEDAGKLIKALFAYVDEGKLPDFKGPMMSLFTVIRTQIDRSHEAYKAKCEKNRSNSMKRKVMQGNSAVTSMDNDRNPSLSTDNDRCPPTTTVVHPNLTPNPNRRTRQTLWSAVQMLTQKLCCQTIHDCPKVVPLHYESE